MTDFRRMLKKYMTHVGECEGVFFLYEDDWGQEDWTEIQAIAQELGIAPNDWY